MSIALQETTSWDFPNHTYLLDDSKTRMIAYISKGTKRAKVFSANMPFSTRHRTFKVVATSMFNIAVVKDPNVVIVQGSKGATYEVNPVKRTCTCPGFMYHHGVCKHLSMVKR